ncbi:MAG: segregation and condensation protein segregation and condensation protein [Candidatus Parcubacteria bacterium]|jgi:segregation and condensation protein B
MQLDILLEGLLFYKSQPLKKAYLVRQFSISEADLRTTLDTLHTRLESGATRLLETDTEVELVTAPALAPFVEELRKQDIKSDIGKAGAETLAIILYQGPITRTEIDRIRGVNSSFILRNLLIRGLIVRAQETKGAGYQFSIAPSLLSHLGITTKEALPDFARITDALETFSATVTDPV